MITLNEARMKQTQAQNKSLTKFFASTVVLSAVCLGLLFIIEQGFYIIFYLFIFALVFLAYKFKLTEFFRPKEYEGEVTYFNVRRERIKKTNSHQAGNTYDTYDVLFGEMIIKDTKGKIRNKTFRFTKEYDNVKPGDKVTVLRFVDKPVIEFQKKF